MKGKFSFATALLLTTKGYKVTLDEPSQSGNDRYEATLNLVYIEVPLTPKVSFAIGSTKIYVALGPYVAVGVGGKARAKLTSNGQTAEDSANVRWGSDEDNQEIKRLDFGLTSGAGVEISNFQIGLSYGYGLSNYSNDNENGFKATNRVLGLSVGYKFGKN
jgi:hypothetical protein